MARSRIGSGLALVITCVAAVAAGVGGCAGADGPAGPPGAIDQPQVDDIHASITALNTQVAALNAAVQALVPTGAILPWAGPPGSIPQGFLLCDGAEVSRSTYSRLFTSIGIAHGGGDGATTFNVPDYRGRFLRGVDMGANRDPNAAARTAPQLGASSVGNTGDAVGSVQGGATALPAAPFSYADNSGWSLCGTPSSIDCTGGGGFTGESGYRADSTRDVSGGGDAETRPVNAGVHWIIRT